MTKARGVRENVPKKPPMERFNAMAFPVPEAGCWLWSGCTHKHGYGSFMDGERTVAAHRFSLEAHLGRPIRKGFFACHKCDTKSCVNPLHLYEGTAQDNANDKVVRGRQSKGAGTGSAKLTEQQVLEVWASAGTHKEIARRYQISKWTVAGIKNGRHWKHVPRPVDPYGCENPVSQTEEE
jgi:hypothetical protein